ncbi:unnamed protein product [Diplocarpon coronariae]|uniref:AB hydrolase-1 domain-containing protein n=1 Tax=Diplocarpon coronariae TaxID=2795749 RepID=A0A218ZE26_9HELO|nr:hypothetical protein B2J93_5294 [Marssonina coronariae]
MAASLTLLLTLGLASASSLTWTPCGDGLDCATLTVPLEYGASSSGAKSGEAQIALARYNATSPSSERLGSMLVNPGGPGGAGATFVKAGAGAAISAITDGRYDIIGWDPRGVGQSTPKLQCFPNAGDEMYAYDVFPSGPDSWAGVFQDPEYDEKVRQEFEEFDVAAALLAESCVEQDSPALFTSSAAYVARDMAAIVDAVDGKDALLNYWGFSYGTIFLAEFVQEFPGRIGRVVADGVVDPEANALTYASQLANDQVSVRDALDDFFSMCEQAGKDCPLSEPPAGVVASMATRFDKLLSSLYTEAVIAYDLPIDSEILIRVVWSYLRVPAFWPRLSMAINQLEAGKKPRVLISMIADQFADEPKDPQGPARGLLIEFPLTCIDNAPSSHITLEEIIQLTKSISIEQQTPLLTAGITPIAFCSHFPDRRPLLRAAGVSRMGAADAVLSEAKKTILIVNPQHDSTTPLKSARKLRSLLPNSSRLAVRGGAGHTTPVLASLSLTETVRNFFVTAELPKADETYHAIDQLIFVPGEYTDENPLAPATYNGTYTESQTKLLHANYNLTKAFLAIA